MKRLLLNREALAYIIFFAVILSLPLFVDLFWLNGDLPISADEQIRFLQKLYSYELPFRNEHVDVLKDIMLVEKNTEYSLYAKTGWAITTR